MKRKIKFLAMAAAALTFAACSEELVPTPEQARNEAPESNVISFSTYMGRTGMTRAGATGSIDTDKLKEAEYGFGVFAYYTGKDSYAAKRTGTSALAPNFMYNQKVAWDESLSDSYITKWKYSPVKYWPNEVATGAVDDQNNDSSNDPATTVYNNGGNLSFFAYAPYVAVSQTTATAQNGAKPTDATEGIVAVSGNEYGGDPYLTYIIPTTTPTVDLLWGTRGNTNKNVLEENNIGITGIMPKEGTPENAAEQYQYDIFKNYTVNADLTKQKTTGKVDFAFKHALSKVGGSYVGGGEGSDDDPTTPTNGLMIVLDIDDMMGAEQGGQLEAAEGDLLDAEKCKYKTKVTVKDIKINVRYQIDEDKVGDPITNYDPEEPNHKTPLVIGGMLNLATGVWDYTNGPTLDKNGQNGVEDGEAIDHEINNTGTGTGVDGQLNENIREPESFTKNTLNGFKSELPIGVTTVPKNVYQDEANPLVFLPGTYPIMTVQVDYIVRTYDDNLSGKYSEVEQVIAKELAFMKPTELNKQYNVLIHLGLTSVKFTASVSDWDANETETTTVTDPLTGDEIPLYTTDAEVYVPQNVEGRVTNVALAQFENDPDNNTGADLNGTKVKYNNYEYENTLLTAANATAIDLAEVPSAGATIQLFAGATIEKKETTTKTYTDVTKNAIYTIAYANGTGWISVDANGKVTVKENTGTAKREATITAIYGDKESTPLTITQRCKSLVITVEGATSTSGSAFDLNPDDLKVSAAGGNWTGYTVFATRQELTNSNNTPADGATATRTNVTASAVFVAVGAKPNYVTLGQNKVTFTANQLAVASTNTRTATVKAKYLGVESGSVVLTQNANTALTLTPIWSAADLGNIPATGAVFNLTKVMATYNKDVAGEEHGPYDVTSDAAITLVSSVDGITISGKTITITANATNADKTFKVKVTYNGGSTEEITITQIH